MQAIQILLTATTAIAALATGCSALDEASISQAETPEPGEGSGGEGDDCDTFTCTNSPELARGGFHELSLRGRLNQQKIRISSKNGRAQIYRQGQAYNLEVVGGRILGTLAAGVGIQGLNLQGATIVLEHVPDGAPPSHLYTIRIDIVRPNLPMPFQQPGTFEAYTFSLYDSNGTPLPDRHLCNGPMLFPPPELEEELLLGMESNETLVFENDRIDATRKRMQQAPDPSWVNFGCAGGTLAKLHLTGHTCLAQGAACSTPAAHASRQTALKLLTADYCGNGKAFTVSGMPLLWRSGVVLYAIPPVGLEARWDANGATCIGTPRLDEHPQGTPPHPKAWDLIAEECLKYRSPIPQCVDQDVNNFDGALAISANRLAY